MAYRSPQRYAVFYETSVIRCSSCSMLGMLISPGASFPVLAWSGQMTLLEQTALTGDAFAAQLSGSVLKRIRHSLIVDSPTTVLRSRRLPDLSENEHPGPRCGQFAPMTKIPRESRTMTSMRHDDQRGVRQVDSTGLGGPSRHPGRSFCVGTNIRSVLRFSMNLLIQTGTGSTHETRHGLPRTSCRLNRLPQKLLSN